MVFFYPVDGYWYADTIAELPKLNHPARARVFELIPDGHNGFRPVYAFVDGEWVIESNWSGQIPSGVNNYGYSLFMNAGGGIGGFPPINWDNTDNENLFENVGTSEEVTISKSGWITMLIQVFGDYAGGSGGAGISIIKKDGEMNVLVCALSVIVPNASTSAFIRCNKGDVLNFSGGGSPTVNLAAVYRSAYLIWD